MSGSGSLNATAGTTMALPGERSALHRFELVRVPERRGPFGPRLLGGEGRCLRSRDSSALAIFAVSALAPPALSDIGACRDVESERI